MFIYRLFLLHSLLEASANGLKVGISYGDEKSLVGRGVLGVLEQDVPRLHILRRYPEPGSHLAHASHSSRLVTRGSRDKRKSLVAEKERLDSMDFQSTPPEPRVHQPSSSHAALSREELPQRPAKRYKSGTTPGKDRSGMKFRQTAHAPDHAHEPLGREGKQMDKNPRVAVLWHFVTPDPRSFQGITNVHSGEQAYYRKISESADSDSQMYKKLSNFSMANPSQATAVATSFGQKNKYFGVRPSKWEEESSTGFRGHSGKIGCCGSSFLPAVHKLTLELQGIRNGTKSPQSQRTSSLQTYNHGQ